MTNRLTDDLSRVDADALGTNGPVRSRQRKRTKAKVAATRSAKSRRKATHGGIHQRTNKRITW